MFKDKRGMIAFYLFMMFVVFIILALVFAKPLTEYSTEAQGTNGLDCDNVTSYQDKANCTSTDLLPFLYIGLTIGLGGLLIRAIAG